MKINRPYVYKVTEKSTGKFYIGKKVAKDKDGNYPMIGEEYFTSSTNNEFRKNFKNHPEDFLCEIIKYGTNIEDTSFFESEEIYKEKNNPLIINRAIPGEAQGGSLQFIYDDKWLEAVKEGHLKAYEDKNGEKYKILVEANKKSGQERKEKNKLLTEEERKKFHHKQTEETKKKISEASKRRWENEPSRETIKKSIKTRSERGWHSNKGLVYPYKFIWISNGNKTTRIKETDEIPEGWHKGRN